VVGLGWKFSHRPWSPNAGLPLVAPLIQRLGLEALINATVRIV
jgi:hypothetical protein